MVICGVRRIHPNGELLDDLPSADILLATRIVNHVFCKIFTYDIDISATLSDGRVACDSRFRSL